MRAEIQPSFNSLVWGGTYVMGIRREGELLAPCLYAAHLCHPGNKDTHFAHLLGDLS